jgi:hypothetical protein
MCQELTEERGRRAAEALVKHLEAMGASAVTIPAEGSNTSVWIVTAKLIAKEPKT